MVNLKQEEDGVLLQKRKQQELYIMFKGNVNNANPNV